MSLWSIRLNGLAHSRPGFIEASLGLTPLGLATGEPVEHGQHLPLGDVAPFVDRDLTQCEGR